MLLRKPLSLRFVKTLSSFSSQDNKHLRWGQFHYLIYGEYKPPGAGTHVDKLHGQRTSWLGASSKNNKCNPPAWTRTKCFRCQRTGWEALYHNLEAQFLRESKGINGRRFRRTKWRAWEWGELLWSCFYCKWSWVTIGGEGRWKKFPLLKQSNLMVQLCCAAHSRRAAVLHCWPKSDNVALLSISSELYDD